MKRHGAVMKAGFIVVALSVATAVGLSVAVGATNAKAKPAGLPDTYVTSWDATGSQAATAAALTPTQGHVIFAYVAIAEYDSVMAIEGGYEPYAVAVEAPEGASAEAAVAAAAHRILVHYLPAQGPKILDPAYAASLTTIPDDQAKIDGVTVGTTVADRLIALRADDGFGVPVAYTPPNPPIPGVWIPTPPPSNPLMPPIGTDLPHMRPFSLDSADQFRPAGPPALDSKKWARDYNEVKDIGSRTSTTRTAEQTLAARFWAEPPVQQAHAALRKFVLDHGLDVVDAARLTAMISVVYADSLIACFDAKYHYAYWRPITAIRSGETDGNDATVGDPAWLPLLPATPNHPEYPSAHACITPAGGRVIARFLNTEQIDFTIPSLTGLGDRHFDRVKDLEYDVNNARIWGGIHYRSAVEDGTKIGAKTMHQVLAHHFHRANG